MRVGGGGFAGRGLTRTRRINLQNLKKEWEKKPWATKKLRKTEITTSPVWAPRVKGAETALQGCFIDSGTKKHNGLGGGGVVSDGYEKGGR